MLHAAPAGPLCDHIPPPQFRCPTSDSAGKYSFDPREWGAISEQAKDLIRHILVTDPTQR